MAGMDTILDVWQQLTITDPLSEVRRAWEKEIKQLSAWHEVE
jgi:hypothetical protein